MGCDRCADIGAEDHRHGLPERHQARIDEAYEHDRACAGTLNHCGHEGPHGTPDNPVVGDHVQDLTHFPPRDLLESLRHDLHAEEEHPQTAERLKHNRYHQIPIAEWVDGDHI